MVGPGSSLVPAIIHLMLRDTGRVVGPRGGALAWAALRAGAGVQGSLGPLRYREPGGVWVRWLFICGVHPSGALDLKQGAEL